MNNVAVAVLLLALLALLALLGVAGCGDDEPAPPADPLVGTYEWEVPLDPPATGFTRSTMTIRADGTFRLVLKFAMYGDGPVGTPLDERGTWKRDPPWLTLRADDSPPSRSPRWALGWQIRTGEDGIVLVQGDDVYVRK